jgi:hypothetical protein
MNLARHLERREAIVEEFDQLARRGRGPRVEHDRSTNILTEPRMGHGEARRLAYRRMSEQRLLNFVGRELLAAAIDFFLAAADDGQDSVLVDSAEVAGRQPAIDKAGGLALDIVEQVIRHDTGSTQHHLAGLTWLQE